MYRMYEYPQGINAGEGRNTLKGIKPGNCRVSSTAASMYRDVRIPAGHKCLGRRSVGEAMRQTV